MTLAAVLLVAIAVVSPADRKMLAEKFPAVRVEDAGRFGLKAADVAGAAELAHGHAAAMRPAVEAFNGPRAVEDWTHEWFWRWDCWNNLRLATDAGAALDAIGDDRLRSPVAARLVRLWSLDELRKSIGDEAYRRGRMPDPTPTYRFPLRFAGRTDWPK
jgi:hypothetical protein